MTAFLLSVLLLLCNAQPAAAVDVVADDTTDAYLISGAAILDVTATDAGDAVTCTTCQWRVIPICDAGTLDDRRSCTSLPMTCPAGSRIAEVWRADAPTMPPVGDPAWNYRGLMCLQEAPVAVATISAAVSELASRAVPALQPSAQPAGTTLTNLPTVFRSGQPPLVLAPAAVVAGTTVTVRAVPSWTWDFGHGSTLTTTDPGGVWPSGRIRHTYPRRGIYRVRVTTTWSATYAAHGITGIPVDGAITQSAWFDLRVREARRFLTTPSTGA